MCVNLGGDEGEDVKKDLVWNGGDGSGVVVTSEVNHDLIANQQAR